MIYRNKTRFLELEKCIRRETVTIEWINRWMNRSFYKQYILMFLTIELMTACVFCSITNNNSICCDCIVICDVCSTCNSVMIKFIFSKFCVSFDSYKSNRWTTRNRTETRPDTNHKALNDCRRKVVVQHLMNIANSISGEMVKSM